MSTPSCRRALSLSVKSLLAAVPSSLPVVLTSRQTFVIMGGGRVIEVHSKGEWDQVMSENAGKAVSGQALLGGL